MSNETIAAKAAELFGIRREIEELSAVKAALEDELKLAMAERGDRRSASPFLEDRHFYPHRHGSPQAHPAGDRRPVHEGEPRVPLHHQLKER